jgi:hypothetical protein
VTIARELYRLKAVQIFDLEDHYAREQAGRGRHPRPFGPIKFYAVGQVVNLSRRDFYEPLELVVQRNPSGYHLFFGVIRLPNGEKRRSYLADGTYMIRVESRYYQRDEWRVTLPMSDPKVPTFFDLLPGYMYPFPKASTLSGGLGPTLLRGGVYDANRQGIARITVEVVGKEHIAYLTDESGQWVLVFPDDPDDPPPDNVTVRFKLSDGTIKGEEDVDIEPGHENSLAPVVLE